ncbi:protein glxC [Aminobacter sp. SR38]|jgi:glutamate synthase domain-containing protein 3|uniref:GltB/FmdC/FwdC-like GXGXG domain-containing protein n=1 Tax=Aminobacter sp. SR38 TaxID=2774562 RepID=UPI001784976A|nr:protein glxC [Aminobacter sp. SR38]QOF73364.1 protein glxC [Aminobacter sp. SR38]
MPIVDLGKSSLRELNAALHELRPNTNETDWTVLNPNGEHSIAVGVDAPVTINIDGPVGYFCGGMNKQATIVIEGNAGQGVGENIMSGLIHVKGDASQNAGATGRGGLLIIDGNASSRCGISMKGVDIVVKGGIGHLSAFMGQTGSLVVFGEAGEALGDSLYEAHLYVRGPVASLGADCVEKKMRDEHRLELFELLKASDEANKVDVGEFRRYGSARKLYNFNIDNMDAY